MTISNHSRRDLIKTAGCAALGLGASVVAPCWAVAGQKTLKILQWNHFVPEYDKWFKNTYVKVGGEKNDTTVIVDNVDMTSLKSLAAAEVAAQRGHDLFMFVSPPSSMEDHVVDHKDIYQECSRKYGKPIDLAIKSTYNPRSKKFYGFADS